MKEIAITEPRINDRIRVPEVRLVGPNGEQVGIVKIDKALRLAADAELDLVEVAPDARPPVAKLMDYGKYKYESAQKARDARRNQGGTQLKEIRFRLKIDPHDYGTKRGHVERFLGQGDKVKVMIMFRGREQSRPEMGLKLLQRLAEDVVELGTVESQPRQDGRNMVMVIAPLKKKAPRAPSRRRSREPRLAEPPAVIEAAVLEAAAAEAAEANSAAVEPASAKPAAAKPVAMKPAVVAPATAKPAAAKPAAVPTPAAPKPAAAAKPAAAKPAVVAAAAAKPAAAKPAVVASAAAKPAAVAKPAVAKPAPQPQ